MACVPGAWTASTAKDHLVLECDVTVTTSEHDAYTLKTPANTIDSTKPWYLMVNSTEVQIDGDALPVDIWAGYSDGFALSGDNGISAAFGGEVASAVMNTVKYNYLAVVVDPNYKDTKVQTTQAGSKTGIVNAGTAPYYAINCHGASAFSGSVTVHFVIIQ